MCVIKMSLVGHNGVGFTWTGWMFKRCTSQENSSVGREGGREGGPLDIE